jgi:ubiquinone/menaquinone biosynthesis C-methylase UbiE
VPGGSRDISLAGVIKSVRVAVRARPGRHTVHPMTDTHDPQYVLGTDQTELARLGIQHHLWSAIAHEAWERARIRPGQRVLDVGCGPGYASTDLAYLVGPAGHVQGVDESSDFIAAARRRADALGLTNCTFTKGDVRDLGAAGVLEESFDAAYARWVLCFVSGPEAVVAGVARALKPGGVLVIQDYYNWQSMRISPESEAYEIVKEASGRAWIDRGGDPDLVAHLLPVVRRLGLEEVDLRIHQRLARPGSTLWAWPDTYWRSFVPRLVASGHITQAQADEFFEAWRSLSRNPDTLLQPPPVYELIVRKPR